MSEKPASKSSAVSAVDAFSIEHEMLQWSEAFRHLPRLSQAMKACRHLQQQGETVTREKVMNLVGGTGSPNTWAPLVKLYKQRRALFDQFNNTPEVLALMLLQTVDQAFLDYRNKFQEHVAAETEAFSESAESYGEEIDALAQVITQLESDNLSQAKQLDTLQQTLAESQGQHQATKDELKSLQDRHRDALHEKEQAEQKVLERDQDRLVLLDEHKSQLKQTEEQHQQQVEDKNLQWEARLAELKVAHEQAQNHLYKQIDKERAAAKTLSDEHLEQMRAAQSKAKEREALVSNLQSSQAKLQAQIDLLQEQAQEHKTLAQRMTEQQETISALNAECEMLRQQTQPQLSADQFRAIMLDTLKTITPDTHEQTDKTES